MKNARSLSGLTLIATLALGACTASNDPGLVRASHGEVTPDAGQPPPAPECTLTQGFWRNHPGDWPVSELTIGGVTYSQAELLALLATEPDGDASLILGRQLIAALLNGGAADPAIAGTIADAMAWMAGNADGDGELPFGTTGGTAAHVLAASLATALTAYNEGRIGPGRCRG